jgi:hypothetical protein
MSIRVNQHIQTLLQDEQVQAQVSGRVFPIIIKGGTPKYPFIVYDKESIEEDTTKDGHSEDSATVSVAIVHKDYEAGIELADRVRYLFEGQTAEYDRFEVTGCTFGGYSEDYIDAVDAFCFTVTLIFRTFDK